MSVLDKTSNSELSTGNHHKSRSFPSKQLQHLLYTLI